MIAALPTLLHLLALVFGAILLVVTCKNSRSSSNDEEDEEQNDDENPVEEDAMGYIPENYTLNNIDPQVESYQGAKDTYSLSHARPTIPTAANYRDGRLTNYRDGRLTEGMRQPEVADASDPNYETLAACPRKNVFGRDKRVVAPMAGMHDPNYQTMAPIQKDVFGEDKARRRNKKPPTPRPPNLTRTMIVPTHDPNYATMAAMDKNVFGPDKKKKEKKIQYANMTIVPGEDRVVAASAPNYQTLARVDNVFGADKKKKKNRR